MGLPKWLRIPLKITFGLIFKNNKIPVSLAGDMVDELIPSQPTPPMPSVPQVPREPVRDVIVEPADVTLDLEPELNTPPNTTLEPPTDGRHDSH